jgi:integrase
VKNLPAYRLHRASNQAVCRILGRVYYLGPFDSQESKTKYQKLIAQYLTDPHFGHDKKSQSIAESVVAFLRYAETYYKTGDEYSQFCRACRPLVDLFGDMHVKEFSVQEFKAYRQSWIAKGSARDYINKQCQRIVRIVKWWVAEQVVEPSLYQAIKCVDPLRKGRCDCPETEPVKPVDDATIEKTMPHLSPVIADMVRLQSVIGCRPGEICRLKPSMVDTSGPVWIVALDHHKTAWRGHDRKIYIGPKGQAILKPYLTDRSKDAFCFSPAESVEQRLQARSSKRITAMSCGNCRGSNRKQAPKRKPGASFTTGSYGRAIAYACTKANLPVWSPNQLRHAAATKLRDIEGIESASLILGHKHLAVTQVYAEKSERKALEIAAKHG